MVLCLQEQGHMGLGNNGRKQAAGRTCHPPRNPLRDAVFPVLATLGSADGPCLEGAGGFCTTCRERVEPWGHLVP